MVDLNETHFTVNISYIHCSIMPNKVNIGKMILVCRFFRKANKKSSISVFTFVPDYIKLKWHRIR